jgi:dolichol-phosphate mannosyltransferase
VLAAVLFMGGVQLLSIGLLGEYVGRIYRQSKGRPLYVIDELIATTSTPAPTSAPAGLAPPAAPPTEPRP